MSAEEGPGHQHREEEDPDRHRKQDVVRGFAGTALDLVHLSPPDQLEDRSPRAVS